MRSRGFWVLALIAFAVRLAYLAQIRDTPLTDVLLIDAGTYDRFARQILAGTFGGEDVYSMNPLYPWFLAGVYALFGGATSAALMFQAALGALNVAMVYSLGRSLLGPGAAWIAGAAAAGYAPYVFFTGALLTPTLVETCMLGTLLALAAWRSRRRDMLLAVAGISLGLTILGRGNAILFLAVAPCFFRVETRAWRPAWRPLLIFVAAALALPMLVTARNLAIAGRFVPISANYAAFYIGHFPRANGLYSSPELATSGSYQGEVVGVRAALSHELGRPLTQAEASRELLERGMRWARTHPREELGLAARKFRYFWNAVEAHTNLSFYVARDFSSVLRGLPLGFGVVAPLGLVGMLAARRRWREHLLLHLAVLVPLATCVVFFVSSEYRLSAVAPLLLFAADAVARTAAWIVARLRPSPAKATRRARSRQVASERAAPAITATTWVAVGLTPVLAWATHTTSPILQSQASTRVPYQNYALAYATRGQLDRAADMVRRAMAADPAAGRVDTEQAQAEQWILAGRYEEALPLLERVHTRYLELGMRDEATNTTNSIALTLHHLGRDAEAERLLLEILATAPAFVGAHNNLGLVYETQGRRAEAIEEYRRTLAFEPGEPEAREALDRLAKERSDH